MRLTKIKVSSPFSLSNSMRGRMNLLNFGMFELFMIVKSTAMSSFVEKAQAGL